MAFKTNSKPKYNTSTQNYKGIPICLILRNYGDRAAYRFTINNTSQNVWIPKKHLLDDGTLKEGEDIDYVFRKAQNQLKYAGVWAAIKGIKHKTEVTEEIILAYNTCKDSDSEPITN